MGLPIAVLRGEIYSARLDPTEGSELQKTRPCLIVSNDIDKRRLCGPDWRILRRWGSVSPQTLEAVNQGLAIALGLPLGG